MNGILNEPYLLLAIKWLMTIVALLIIYYDFRYLRIPDFLVISIGILSLIKVVIDYQYISFLNELFFPIIALVSLLIILTWFYPQGLGGGDIKYLLALSIFFQWWIFLILWLASLTGILQFLVIKKKINKKTKIPFGIHISIWTIVFLHSNYTQNLFLFDLL